jgi:hypothetical protein
MIPIAFLPQYFEAAIQNETHNGNRDNVLNKAAFNLAILGVPICDSGEAA